MSPFPSSAAISVLRRFTAAQIITRERRRRAYVVSADEWLRYTGAHADLLRRMCIEAHDEALTAYDAGDLTREQAGAVLDHTPEALIDAALAARTDGYLIREKLVGDWGRDTGTIRQWEVAPVLATDSVQHRRAA